MTEGRRSIGTLPSASRWWAPRTRCAPYPVCEDDAPPEVRDGADVRGWQLVVRVDSDSDDLIRISCANGLVSVSGRQPLHRLQAGQGLVRAGRSGW
jgi:hypothetical protein